MLNQMPFSCQSNTPLKEPEQRILPVSFSQPKLYTCLFVQVYCCTGQISCCWDKTSNIQSIRRSKSNFIHDFRGSVYDCLILKQELHGAKACGANCELHSNQKAEQRGGLPVGDVSSRSWQPVTPFPTWASPPNIYPQRIALWWHKLGIKGVHPDPTIQLYIRIRKHTTR